MKLYSEIFFKKSEQPRLYFTGIFVSIDYCLKCLYFREFPGDPMCRALNLTSVGFNPWSGN